MPPDWKGWMKQFSKLSSGYRFLEVIVKQLLMLLGVMCLLLLSFGCSEKDDNPTNVQVQGYKLDQFIINSTVIDSLDPAQPDSLEFRDLYAYEIVSGEDGFSPRMSSYAGYDLPWQSFKAGYLIPTDDFRTWFADPSLPGAFKVKNTGLFRLYRKIDVIAPDNSSKLVELKGLTIHTITNWDNEQEPAVKLSDLLTGFTEYDSVSIVCFDDWGMGMYYSPEAINDGYYLLETERTIFPNVTVPSNMRKMKKVSYLQVYGTESAQNHVFELAPDTSADLIFTVPDDLSGFELTTIPDYPN